MDTMTRKTENRKAQKQSGTALPEPTEVVWTNFRVPKGVRKDMRFLAVEREIPYDQLCSQALAEFVERNKA